jgi:hypothetical protein
MKVRIINLSLLLCAAVIFAACEQNDPTGDETTPFDGKITGQILTGDGVSIAQIKAFDYKEEWVVATAPVQNGSFTLTLPQTVESSHLSSFSLSSTITVSDAGVKQTHINTMEGNNLIAYDSDGKDVGVIVCQSADEKTAIVNFMYVDRDCKISGSYNAGSNRTLTYNADLKTGWNILYGKITNDNGDFEYTTTKPAVELEWHLYVQ